MLIMLIFFGFDKGPEVVHLHVKKMSCFVMFRENVYFLRLDAMTTPIASMELMKSDVEHLEIAK